MVLSEIATYLASNGIGTAGTDLFYGPMKEVYPSAVTLINEYGGTADEPNMSDANGSSPSGKATRIEYPRIQILCRGVRDDYDGPRAKAESARTAIAKILNQTLSGVYYLSAEILQPPFRMRTDENFREEIVFNVQLVKHLS